MWILVNKKNPEKFIAEDFSSRGEAEAHLEKLGPVVGNYYRVQSNTGIEMTDRLLP